MSSWAGFGGQTAIIDLFSVIFRFALPVSPRPARLIAENYFIGSIRVPQLCYIVGDTLVSIQIICNFLFCIACFTKDQPG